MSDEMDPMYKLGALESTVVALQKDMTELTVEQKKQTEMLQRLTAHMERQKGGLGVLIGAATVAGAIATLVVEWVKK